jgi:uncharacterized membrane protein
MPFNLYAAVVAGLWGTFALTAFLMIGLARGWVHLDFASLLGGIFMPLNRKGRSLGLAMHFAFGAGFALLYAWIFDLVGLWPGAWTPFVGTMFGLYHWVFSMFLIDVARRFNPHVQRGEARDPGTWGIKLGPQEAVMQMLGHLIYGTTVGFAYFAVATATQTVDGGVPNDAGRFLLVALAAAVSLSALYVYWLPSREEEVTFASEMPEEHEIDREAKRRELRARYDRGEITWDEYQHLRRQWSGEP